MAVRMSVFDGEVARPQVTREMRSFSMRVSSHYRNYPTKIGITRTLGGLWVRDRKNQRANDGIKAGPIETATSHGAV
jgi:hypothetical protein